MKIAPEKTESWLRSPVSCPCGTLWMAGRLHDATTIPTHRMRVLGRRAFIFMLHGTGFYEDAAGTRLKMRPGDALLLGPTLPHAYGSADGAPWGQVYVVFDGPQFELLEHSEVYRAHQPRWHLEPVELWQRRLEELFLQTPRRDAGDALLLVSRFAGLLVEMATTDAEGRRDPDEAWLEESLHLLGEPHREGWLDPRVVARSVGQSYETFRKRFAERAGLAPGRFQQQRRIDLACAEIFRGRDNFKELAEELGFCDVYHFSKVFRRHVGEPPSTYRRRVRGG
jgi:AraC-like DNA-binding protein